MNGTVAEETKGSVSEECTWYNRPGRKSHGRRERAKRGTMHDNWECSLDPEIDRNPDNRVLTRCSVGTAIVTDDEIVLFVRGEVNHPDNTVCILFRTCKRNVNVSCFSLADAKQ